MNGISVRVFHLFTRRRICISIASCIRSFSFLPCFSWCYASRQIRWICRIIFSRFLKLLSGTCASVSFLYFCLFENTVQSTRGNFVSRVPGNGDPAGFFRMCILAMTPFHYYEVPSIGFDDLITSLTFRSIPPILHNFFGCICTLGFSIPSTPSRIALVSARVTNRGGNTLPPFFLFIQEFTVSLIPLNPHFWILFSLQCKKTDQGLFYRQKNGSCYSLRGVDLFHWRPWSFFCASGSVKSPIVHAG